MAGNPVIRNPKTLGDKIRKRRLELGLLQRDIAALIGVTEDCVTYWENNRAKPHIHYYPKIIKFLGYFPFEIDASSLKGKITYYRYIHGVTQEEFAKQLEVNESTVFHYEKGTHKPMGKTLRKMEVLLSFCK